MSEPASISAGIAQRYATAIFEIAQENDNLDGLERSLDDLGSALADSADMRTLISSPVISRSDQEAAIKAIAAKMDLAPVMQNALALMASNRRLFVVPQLISALRSLLAEIRNEVTADVISAKALTDAQTAKLAQTLTARMGKTVTVNATVDDSLIGGLVVKVGSKMIDTSIRSKLASLQNAMKEVG